MRLSKLIFLILFLPGLAFGGGDYYLGASGVVGGVCTSQINFTDTTQALALGYDSTIDYVYNWGTFTTVGAFTGYTFYVYLKKTGTPAVNIQLAVCTVSSGNPNVCTNADAVVGSATLTTSYAPIKYNIAAGYAFDATTIYGIRLFWDGAVSNANYASWGFNNSGSFITKYSPDGAAWTQQDGSAQASIVIKDCAE